MEKNRKGLLLIIILLLVAITGGLVSFTYSRYLSTAKGTDTAKVAPWVVKVNGDDIVTNVEKKYTQSDITWEENDYIEDGYIAPGRVGTFEIEIDPTGSKVAMQYDLEIDTTSLDNYDQINIVEVKVGNETLTETGDKYTGLITLDEVLANTKKTVVVTIEWENMEENNESDTTIGSTVTELEIPVTVTVSQYLG